MTGIYDCFGYGPGYDVPFDVRYNMIKSVGFDCVMSLGLRKDTVKLEAHQEAWDIEGAVTCKKLKDILVKAKRWREVQ